MSRQHSRRSLGGLQVSASLTHPDLTGKIWVRVMNPLEYSWPLPAGTALGWYAEVGETDITPVWDQV